MSSAPSESSSSSSSSMAPWLLNACRSFTSLRARQVTGTHLLRIEGYSAAERMVQRGEFIESCTFSAAGHKWRLRYFPNAYKAGPPPPTAVELELMNPNRNDDDQVVAAYRLSVLGRDGEPALSYTVGPQRFNKDHNYRHRVGVLVTPEERREALRFVEGGDTLAVRCDVTVTRFDKESCLKWYLRKFLD